MPLMVVGVIWRSAAVLTQAASTISPVLFIRVEAKCTVDGFGEGLPTVVAEREALVSRHPVDLLQHLGTAARYRGCGRACRCAGCSRIGALSTTMVAWFYRNRCHRDGKEKDCELHGGNERDVTDRERVSRLLMKEKKWTCQVEINKCSGEWDE